ncbi:MAG: hypothetical protein KKE16_01135 [Firmicutes bacterium]|nr:hypothetical protein [Bacillota bacterium]
MKKQVKNNDNEGLNAFPRLGIKVAISLLLAMILGLLLFSILVEEGTHTNFITSYSGIISGFSTLVIGLYAIDLQRGIISEQKKTERRINKPVIVMAGGKTLPSVEELTDLVKEKQDYYSNIETYELECKDRTKKPNFYLILSINNRGSEVSTFKVMESHFTLHNGDKENINYSIAINGASRHRFTGLLLKSIIIFLFVPIYADIISNDLTVTFSFLNQTHLHYKKSITFYNVNEVDHVKNESSDCEELK